MHHKLTTAMRLNCELEVELTHLKRYRADKSYCSIELESLSFLNKTDENEYFSYLWYRYCKYCLNSLYRSILLHHAGKKNNQQGTHLAIGWCFARHDIYLVYDFWFVALLLKHAWPTWLLGAAGNADRLHSSLEPSHKTG
jgi:hypothetical protein